MKSLAQFLEPIHSGEQELKDFLRMNGYTVEDVSDNSAYWDKDIDLIATSPRGATRTIEVKWDKRIAATGNLYLELTANKSKDGLGWYKFCQADYLYYGDAINNAFYVIKLSKLREFVSSIEPSLRVARCITETDDSTGYLLPLDLLINTHLIYNIISL